ncbi:hypothetical protein HDU81_005680 [Chytriomyces hyalinus]|nr:hypothetical protein HDU81_005680 [Chytriomyces hyalinus]
MDVNPRLVDSWSGMVSMGCYDVRYKAGAGTLVLDSNLGVSVPTACLDYCAHKSVELVVGLVRVASESELLLHRGLQSAFVCSCAYGVSRLIKTDDYECNVRCQASNRLLCGSEVVLDPLDQMDAPLVPTSVYSRFLDYAPTQGGCFPRSITLDMDMSRFRLPQKSVVPSVLSRPGECLSVCVSVTDMDQRMFALISPNRSDPSRPSIDCLCVVLSQLDLMVLQMYSIDQSQCDSPCDASSSLVCGSPSSETYSLYSLPPPDKMMSNFVFNPPSATDIPSETDTPVPTISKGSRFFTTDSTSSPPPQEKASASPIQKSTVSSQSAAPSVVPTTSLSTSNRGESSVLPTLSNGQRITITTATAPTSSQQPQLNAIITDDTPDDIDIIVTSRISGTVLTFKMSKTAAPAGPPTLALVSPSLAGIPSEKSPNSGTSSVTTAAIASSVGILLVAFLLVANFTAIKVRRERRKSQPVTAQELHESMHDFKSAELKSPTDLYYSAHRPTAITAESPRVKAQTLELSNTTATNINNTSLSFLEGGPIGMPRLSSQYYATTTPSLPRLLALNLDGSVPGKGKQSLQIDRRSMGSKYHAFGASTQLGAMHEEEPQDLDTGEEKDQAYHIIAAYRSGILARESETSLVSSLNSSTQLGVTDGDLKKSESSVYMDVLSGNDELEQRWL